MGFRSREVILPAAFAGALLASIAGCGAPGETGRSGARTATGEFPAAIAQSESTFDPSDYGIESWETGSSAGRGETAAPGGDTVTVTVPDTLQGFRVQVTITEDIDYASGLRDSLSRALPGEWVYVVHHPPYYKVRVGNFSERFAATGLLDSLRRRGFPDAWIVPDRVLRNPLPPPTGDEPLPPDTLGAGDPER
jgi:hypothetical protein